MTKDFLGGLTVELLPTPFSALELSLIKRLYLNNESSGNLLRALKNLGLGLDISQGPIIVSHSKLFLLL